MREGIKRTLKYTVIALLIIAFILPTAAHQVLVLGWNDLVTLLTGHPHIGTPSVKISP